MMVSEAERMARAGEYVLGRMTEAERERAERDLERDAQFRAAVLAVAERMRFFGSGRGDPAKAAAAQATWADLGKRLSSLPHMRDALSEALVHPAVPLDGGRPDQPTGSRERPFRWRRVASALVATLFRRLQRQSAPQAAAILQSKNGTPSAMLENFGGGSLRLLLLHDFELQPDEQLALWAWRDDRAPERLACFGACCEFRLNATPGPASYAGFALARERKALPAPGRLAATLAEGAVMPLPASARAAVQAGRSAPIAADG